MKKRYEKPELEFVGFEYKTVCSTSGTGGTGGEGDIPIDSIKQNGAANSILTTPLNSIFGGFSDGIIEGTSDNTVDSVDTGESWDTDGMRENWSLEIESEQ